MTETVRWGIHSTGKIARAFAEALKDTPGAVLAAGASRSLAGAQAFADEFGAPAAFGSYQELADAPGIDIVYIGTPHPMHADNAMMALRGGKAVLCEKAFTMNRREAEQVVALAREKKLFLMEAMWTRFMPALAAEGLSTACFKPLPVLGVPGWWDGQDEAFYADASVFRPKKQAPDSAP